MNIIKSGVQLIFADRHPPEIWSIITWIANGMLAYERRTIVDDVANILYVFYFKLSGQSASMNKFSDTLCNIGLFGHKKRISIKGLMKVI